jgi:hypothetical protein
MVVNKEVKMTEWQRSWPTLRRYPAICLVGLRKRTEYTCVQDGRLPGKDRHKELPESKSEALDLETKTSLASYKKAAHIFLLLHYVRKSFWALCRQVLSYTTNVDTHRTQTLLYEVTSLGFERIYSVVIIIP